jgi:hypothetical protein
MVRALLEVEMLEKCMPMWREARFQVKMAKAPHALLELDVEKVGAVVTRSALRSQKC